MFGDCWNYLKLGTSILKISNRKRFLSVWTDAAIAAEEGQGEALEPFIGGKDAFILLPTGSGKNSVKCCGTPQLTTGRRRVPNAAPCTNRRPCAVLCWLHFECDTQRVHPSTFQVFLNWPPLSKTFCWALSQMDTRQETVHQTYQVWFIF